MRKSVMGDGMMDRTRASAGPWRDLERIARVEVSSEDEQSPIENALVLRSTSGWRAGAPGPQAIRMYFDEAIAVRRIEVQIVERESARSQEFAIYAGATMAEMREVVRQQFTFSPDGSTEEREEYQVMLDGVRVMEVRIDPDRVQDATKSVAYASLLALRVG